MMDSSLATSSPIPTGTAFQQVPWICTHSRSLHSLEAARPFTVGDTSFLQSLPFDSVNLVVWLEQLPVKTKAKPVLSTSLFVSLPFHSSWWMQFLSSSFVFLCTWRNLSCYLFMPLIKFSSSCALASLIPSLWSPKRDLRRSLGQTSARNRLCSEVRPCWSGLYQAASWKPPRMEAVLRNMLPCLTINIGNLFSLFPVWTYLVLPIVHHVPV